MKPNGNVSREVPIMPGSLWRTLGPSPVEHCVLVVANVHDVSKEPTVISSDSVGNVHARRASSWVRSMVPTTNRVQALGLSPMFGLLPTPIVDVIGERDRQKRVLGFSDQIDDTHGTHTLIGAALNLCHSGMEYLAGADPALSGPPFKSAWPHVNDEHAIPWPWKPKGAVKDIERAAALLLAQLEKLAREARRGRLTDLPAESTGVVVQ